MASKCVVVSSQSAAAVILWPACQRHFYKQLKKEGKIKEEYNEMEKIKMDLGGVLK